MTEIELETTNRSEPDKPDKAQQNATEPMET